MVPLAKPAIIVMAILSFQNSWNEFLGPLIYLKDSKLHTLALGLYYFRTSRQGSMQNLQMAATVMMVIPVLVVFFLFQRQFVQGANLSCIKG